MPGYDFPAPGQALNTTATAYTEHQAAGTDATEKGLTFTGDQTMLKASPRQLKDQLEGWIVRVQVLTI